MPDDPEVEETPPIKQMRAHIKELEQQATAAAEFQTRAETAERKLAFAEAGIDLSHPVAKLLAKTYDGELTPEAIKAEATTLGLVAPQAETPDPNDEALARMNEASAPPSRTPTTEAAYKAELASAVTEPEVMAVLAKYGRLKPVG